MSITDTMDGTEPETDEEADDEGEEEFTEDWSGIPPDQAEELRSPLEEARAKLTPDQREILARERKRAHDLGYPTMFDAEERDTLPHVAEATRRYQEVQAAKAERRKALLREYPTMRTAADGPPDSAA